jgi:hydrogenase/urease accessory protein HupE
LEQTGRQGQLRQIGQAQPPCRAQFNDQFTSGFRLSQLHLHEVGRKTGFGIPLPLTAERRVIKVMLVGKDGGR